MAGLFRSDLSRDRRRGKRMRRKLQGDEPIIEELQHRHNTRSLFHHRNRYHKRINDSDHPGICNCEVEKLRGAAGFTLQQRSNVTNAFAAEEFSCLKECRVARASMLFRGWDVAGESDGAFRGASTGLEWPTRPAQINRVEHDSAGVLALNAEKQVCPARGG